MDLSFEFSILLNLNKEINLKKVYILEKSRPTAEHALLKNLKRKKNYWGFFLRHGPRHNTCGHDMCTGPGLSKKNIRHDTAAT